MPDAIVIAVSKNPIHSVSKNNCASINLVAGKGVEGDAHFGEKVKHRSRVRANPDQPNLRQVHLIHSELFTELDNKGFNISPGLMGENITTSGINLLALPKGTILKIGPVAIIEITGLRNPCNQLDGLAPGLMQAVLDRDEKGNLIRKSGIMGIVIQGGTITVGDTINATLPEKPHQRLERV